MNLARLPDRMLRFVDVVNSGETESFLAFFPGDGVVEDSGGAGGSCPGRSKKIASPAYGVPILPQKAQPGQHCQPSSAHRNHQTESGSAGGKRTSNAGFSIE
jgi:hypothetical protein